LIKFTDLIHGFFGYCSCVCVCVCVCLYLGLYNFITLVHVSTTTVKIWNSYIITKILPNFLLFFFFFNFRFLFYFPLQPLTSCIKITLQAFLTLNFQFLQYIFYNAFIKCKSDYVIALSKCQRSQFPESLTYS